MKIDQEIVQQIVQSVAPELWWLLVQMLATGAICLALYKGINALVSYYYVRFDKELGKNVGVVVDGRKGYISQVTMRHIIIKYDDDANDVHAGNDLLIPITQVASKTWEIIRRKD